ncbi:MAG: hypothetical protein P9X27_05755 [Candidatus Kaelpia aquatica]|nr:hypothetical protein [Candidatus Kaelpia aquatica]
MKKKKRSPKFKISKVNVKIEHKDDSMQLDSLMRVIYLALELSDKTDKEAEEIQSKFFAGD